MQQFSDDPSGRIWGPSAAVAVAMMAAVASASCAFDLPDRCEQYGVHCQQGQECAASQIICIDIGGCGNGVLDPGEVCDDGNIVDGGTDDAGTLVLDSCSHDCTSTQECGNQLKDPGEECDEGTRNGDRGATCDLNCRLVCGNSTIDADVGEECDPGPTDSAMCNSNMAGPVSCKVATCGDGYTNMAAGETCDNGAADTSTCNGNTANPATARCQLSICGDNHVNIAAGEQCDPGLNDTAVCNGPGAGSAKCKLASCGDGYFNVNAETCDNGMGCPAGKTCSATCTCI